MSSKISRRSFMVGCCSAIAAYAGSRITNLAFAAGPKPDAINSNDRLVVVFLRGGWDALNIVPPIAGTDRGLYLSARPNIYIPTSGANAALNLDGQFGLHPSMAPLLPFYQAKKLAIVHAVGLNYDTRSHFDAQEFIELGTPGLKTSSSGWITRYLQSSPALKPGVIFPALATGGSQPMSLMGTLDAVAMNDPSGFALNGNWQYELEQRAALRDLYAGTNWLCEAGTETLDTVDLIESTSPGTYVPSNGAVYPTNSTFADNLKAIAQIIKMQLGLEVATVDLGGWDTHEHEGDTGSGYIAGQLNPLAQALAAFYTDLNGGCGANFIKRTTVVVISEFGRRLKENGNRGTDHGHGSVMLILGGSVNGGKVYGQWPGLSTAQLYDGGDLAVTTDYRAILSEIVERGLGNPNISTVFPGFTSYTPLGLINLYAPVPAPVPTPTGLNKKTYLPITAKAAFNDNLCP
jgi:uncharacterized protein (DUF1501 family)